MPRALIIDRRLSQVQRALRLADVPSTWSRIGRGLISAPVSDAQWESVQGSCSSAVIEDLPMGVRVRGNPMDMHGEGRPLPSWVGLRSRLADAGQPAAGEGVLVGTVDTGVRMHPWLAGGYLSAPDDFEDPSTGPGGSAGAQVGHGTFVAGLVLQQAPAAGVWVERALAADGEALASQVATAALALAERGVHVLNLSLGCYADDPGARPVMQRLVDDLRSVNPEMVVVAAAGNLLGRDEPAGPATFWPAALDDVVAVGAVTDPAAATWAEWSNRGPWVDLAAPGHVLLSTHVRRRSGADNGGGSARGWAWWSGTSFAAAVVSGAIASLMTTPERISAREAVARLRTGELSTGWTEAEADVPSVPVVGLRTWDQLGTHRDVALAELASAGSTAH